MWRGAWLPRAARPQQDLLHLGPPLLLQLRPPLGLVLGSPLPVLHRQLRGLHRWAPGHSYWILRLPVQEACSRARVATVSWSLTQTSRRKRRMASRVTRHLVMSRVTRHLATSHVTTRLVTSHVMRHLATSACSLQRGGTAVVSSTKWPPPTAGAAAVQGV